MAREGAMVEAWGPKVAQLLMEALVPSIFAEGFKFFFSREILK